jgi:3-methyl-2-oxobutanoate hydroxymethyltransferase
VQAYLCWVISDCARNKFGKTTEERQQLLKDAKAVQDAGAFAIVAEMVDAETCAAIAASVNIPIIGIGSGAGCDGQILVISDVLGLTPTKPPSFAKVYVDGRQLLGDALKSYVQEVQQKQFPKS